MKHCPACKQQYSPSQRFCPQDGKFLSLQDPYHLLGRSIAGQYSIDALVAIGGFGAVYSAHHEGTGRHVAFKILLPHLASANEDIRNLFEREAKIASQFFHENIALVFDAGRTEDNIAYIAMEWLDGQTLADVLKKQGRFNLERASHILRQVANALDTAHAANVIHRDLKPSNVMLVRRKDGSENVKVLDFGIGKVISETGDSTVSMLVGTPDYASPEQFVPGGHIGRRTDIYSLGVMLYQMITGELPYQATAGQ